MEGSYDVPAEDRWVIDGMARAVIARLTAGRDSPTTRGTLIRLLLQLQLCPAVAKDINLAIEGKHWQVSCSTESLGGYLYTPDGHTEFRVEYFRSSHHCIAGYESLDGVRRTRALAHFLEVLNESLASADDISCEDYSGEAAFFASCEEGSDR